MSSVKAISDSEFKTTIDSDTPTVIDFWAEWCGPCRMIKPVMEKLSGEYPNINACKMDVDQNSQTPMEFGITSIPTIILFHKGKEIDRVIGSSAPMLKNLFEKGKAI